MQDWLAHAFLAESVELLERSWAHVPIDLSTRIEEFLALYRETLKEG